MCRLQEGELEFDFKNALKGRKFDDPKTYRLSHCMKSVDFIVEFPDKYLFVEVKDPQQSGVTEDRRQKWCKKLTSGKLDQDLKYKYRDSFLYEWGLERGDDKPILYAVLIGLDTLDDALLLRRQEALCKALPIHGPGSKL